MSVQGNVKYFSPIVIKNLAQSLSEDNVILIIDQNGGINLTLKKLIENPFDAPVEFVKRGTLDNAVNYDKGRFDASLESAETVQKATQQLHEYETLVQQRINDVRQQITPTIHVDTQEKIDNIFKVIDSLSFQPGIAQFGKQCTTQREELDRCYLANPKNTITCRESAISFCRCAFPENFSQGQFSDIVTEPSNV